MVKKAAKKVPKADESHSAKSEPSSTQKWLRWTRRYKFRAATCGAAVVLLVAWIAAHVLPKPDLPRAQPVERIPLAEMSSVRFIQEYATQKPVVFTGAWREDGWRPEELVATCRHARIRTFRHDDKSETWARQVQVGVSPLSEYHADYFEPAPSQRPQPLLYGFEMELKKHCPSKLEEVNLPSFFTEDAFHLVTNRTGLGWPSVLFGPQGSVTGLHIDTHRLPFWIAVVAPKNSSADQPLKRVRIFSHEDMRLFKYGKSLPSVNMHFLFDPWRPDLQKFPDVADTLLYETELRSGDMLYIPGGSPHAVINLADNVGVSMNYLDLKSMPNFVRKCNKGSPLCGLLAGKGEWVITAMENRRNLGKDLSYWEFAGIHNLAEFCEVHGPAAKQEDLPALAEYCRF